MDYSQLSDFEINKRIFKELTGAKPLGYPHDADGRSVGNESNGNYCWYDYCNKPADAWPIITKNKISIYAMSKADKRGAWGAEAFHPNDAYSFNDNPLRAAMIVFLMMQDKS